MMQGTWGILRDKMNVVIGGFYDWQLNAPITDSYQGAYCAKWELVLYQLWVHGECNEGGDIIVEAYGHDNGIALLCALPMPRLPENDGAIESNVLLFTRQPAT